MVLEYASCSVFSDWLVFLIEDFVVIVSDLLILLTCGYLVLYSHLDTKIQWAAVYVLMHVVVQHV